MTKEAVLIQIHGPQDGFATITLDRPDKANALTAEMISGLRDAFREAVAQGARAIMLTGRGKVFSAGADLEAVRAGLAVSPLWEELSATIAEAPALTIAALNGTAAGGALGMVLACDLRIAVPGIRIFYPVMKLGFLPQPSDPARLRALVGPSRAKTILMAGQRIEAETALSWGLLDKIVAPDGLEAAARELAADALAASGAHVAGIKRLIAGRD